MGVKRRAPKLQDAEKKTKFEVVHTGSGLETEQAMLDQILREVRAPNNVQTKLDNWIQQISNVLSSCHLPQLSSMLSIKNFPLKDVDDIEFPGGRVTSCQPVGSLKTKSLGEDIEIL